MRDSHLKEVGCIVIIAFCIVGTVFSIRSRHKPPANEKETSNEQVVNKGENDKKSTTADASTETSTSETTDENVFDANEGGTDKDSENIKSLDITIKGMDADFLKEIPDEDAFMYQAKKYIYENGYVDCEFSSMNQITLKQNEHKKYYLISIDGKNQFFYIVYDLKENTYSSLAY